MYDGGYEAGYAACACFWGDKPGSLIARLLDDGRILAGLRVLDAGCGEGKNAFALATRGARVDAVDCSARAIGTGRLRFGHPAIAWHIADLTNWPLLFESYDIIIAYGMFHCLPTEKSVKSLADRLKAATRRGGLHVVCAFNSGPHDLSAHPGFKPTLLPHEQYVALYDGWRLNTVTSSLIHETHPHNGIAHYHSLTRLIAEKT